MLNTGLLTREEFRNKCLQRDNHQCIFCNKKDNLSIHHIIERKLWENGGYYLNNGATLCESCHIKAEETTISCDEIREKAGITQIVLPEHLSGNIDKWGNILQSNGRRLKGELFLDESVQKILKQGNVLDQFDDYFKYPKTMHFPWSENLQNDDRRIENLDGFMTSDNEVVMLEKMDGENCTMYNDYIHVRSVSPLTPHPSRTRVKQIWERVRRDIPDNWRICGENCQAKHSIYYDNLEDYFLVFNIWENNKCFNWDDTVEICNMLGLKTVPQLWRGNFDSQIIQDMWSKESSDLKEGYVVRVTRSFTINEFGKVVGKFVRKNHVQTSKFWMKEPMIENKLK